MVAIAQYVFTITTVVVRLYHIMVIAHRRHKCFAVVKWDYLAVNEDELTLRKGESVAVYCRDEAIIGDVGWWYVGVGLRWCACRARGEAGRRWEGQVLHNDGHALGVKV